MVWQLSLEAAAPRPLPHQVLVYPAGLRLGLIRSEAEGRSLRDALRKIRTPSASAAQSHNLTSGHAVKKR
jgi:hypothetical protein